MGLVGFSHLILNVSFFLTLYSSRGVNGLDNPDGLNSTHFFNFELLSWSPPPELQTLLPYYLCGHDIDHSPVWYVNVGHWKFKEALRNRELERDTLKYCTQVVERVCSPELVSLPENPQTTFTVVVNMDGFGLNQFLQLRTVEILLNSTSYAVKMWERKGNNINRVMAVNVNYVFHNLFLLLKPLLGGLTTKMEMYGTNPRKWKPILLAQIPRSQLPGFLGGFKNYTYLQAYD